LAGFGTWAQPEQETKAPRGYLGVRLAPAEEGAKGVMVREVTPEGPAAQAGLKNGDRLVTVNDETVRDLEAFSRGIAGFKAGDMIRLGIVRDGKEQSLTVTLAERREREAPGIPDFRGRGRTAFLGVQAQPLTPELRDRLNAKADAGVVVMGVSPNSPAAKAGLKRDDVITAIGDHAVKSPEDLSTAIQKVGAGKEVTVRVARGTEELKLKVTLQEGSPGGFGAPGEDRFPMFDMRTLVEQSKRIAELEKRVAELEKRIRELEKK
jgi:serine protease Do